MKLHKLLRVCMYKCVCTKCGVGELSDLGLGLNIFCCE